MRRLIDDKMNQWQEVAYSLFGYTPSALLSEIVENFKEVCQLRTKRVELDWDVKLRRLNQRQVLEIK